MEKFSRGYMAEDVLAEGSRKAWGGKLGGRDALINGLGNSKEKNIIPMIDIIGEGNRDQKEKRRRKRTYPKRKESCFFGSSDWGVGKPQKRPKKNARKERGESSTRGSQPSAPSGE